MKKFPTFLTLTLLMFSGSAGAQTQAPVLNVNPVLVDFGIVDVGFSETQAISLINLTAAPLPITGFNASGDASFSIDVNGGSDPCGSENPTIDPDGFCTMTVTYAPTIAQDSSGSVSFTPNNQASLSVNARFLGEGLDSNSGGGCNLSNGTSLGGGWILLPILLAWSRRFRRNRV